jgi:hypothetical protein
MTPTPLRDRLLFLEARMALIEDRWSVARQALRDWAKSLLIVAELVAFALLLRFIDRKHLSHGGVK